MKNIAIFSVPRSGSTWLGQIFNSSPEVLYRFQPNFSYSFPPVLNRESDSDAIEQFHRDLAVCSNPFVCGELSISGKKNITFPKLNPKVLVWKETHFLFLAETLLRNSDTWVIGLVRSPLSVIASWIRIPKEFNPQWDIMTEWRLAQLKNEDRESHYFGYEKWKEATHLFEALQSEFPSRFYLLNYDELLQKKEEIIDHVFSFCGLEMHSQVADFMQRSSTSDQKDAYSVFKTKQKDDGWKNILPDYIIEEITKDPDFVGLNNKYLWV